MAKISERALQMMENFMTLHQEGYSIYEIAAMFNLSDFTVKYHLQEIADANGVSRESLLKVVKPRRNQARYYREEEKRVKTNWQELTDNFDSATASVEGIIDTINNILEDNKMEE